jgi:hypothetical protein
LKWKEEKGILPDVKWLNECEISFENQCFCMVDSTKSQLNPYP